MFLAFVDPVVDHPAGGVVARFFGGFLHLEQTPVQRLVVVAQFLDHRVGRERDVVLILDAGILHHAADRSERIFVILAHALAKIVDRADQLGSLFVEQDAQAVKAIRANIDTFDARSRCVVQQASVMSLGPAKAPHDLILLDPPYETGAGYVALERLTRLGWIGSATWIALETGAKEASAMRTLELVAERKTGKAKISLLRLAG